MEDNNLNEIEVKETTIETVERYDEEGRISYQKTEEVKSTFLKNNILAYLGFITSFVIPVLPVIICIVSLKQIKYSHEGGKKLAIMGIFINIVLMSIVFIAYPLWKKDQNRRNNVPQEVLEMCESKYSCDGDEDNNGFETCSYQKDNGEIINIECPIKKK